MHWLTSHIPPRQAWPRSNYARSAQQQNNTFRDNYLGVLFDLSKGLFIGAANVLDSIFNAYHVNSGA